MQRHYLFLQGVCSPFFSQLARRLHDTGARISRINFNMGDSLYWGRAPAWRYAGAHSGWRDYLAEKFQSRAITDMILFGDRRPLHQVSHEVATYFGARIHVFEEGYFRPHWVTLERGGVNKYSALPRNPDWYRAHAAHLAEPSFTRIQSPLWIRGAHDAIYHLANLGNPIFYPGYRTHRPYISGQEYAGWARRFPQLPWHRRKDVALIAKLLRAQQPYFVLPLQLNSDSQITEHSPFKDMLEVIDHVTHSFAQHAPSAAHLIIKNHPLDTGFTDYAGHIRARCREFNLQDRLHYMETGDLQALLSAARGIITVNSTLGTQALESGCPVKTLADPIYNLPGLTAQSPLDDFWHAPTPPDPSLFAAYRKVLMHTVLVNGGFYNQPSIALAVENSLRLILPERAPLEELLT